MLKNQMEKWLIDRQTDRQTGRQTDRQTGRQTDRHADRQTDMHTLQTSVHLVKVL